MDRIQWIKELVRSEQEMEDTGIVDLAFVESQETLGRDTEDFMLGLKTAFIEAASAFNQLKGSAVGTLKIYGIAKTQCDFMLFRNGHKMIFTKKAAGQISIYVSSMGTMNRTQLSPNIDQLIAEWGPFGELKWMYSEQEIKLDYLVRHYTTRFIKESAK